MRRIFSRTTLGALLTLWVSALLAADGPALSGPKATTPAKSDVSKSDAIKTDSAKADVSKSDAAKTEAVTPDKADTAKAEAPKADDPAVLIRQAYEISTNKQAKIEDLDQLLDVAQQALKLKVTAAQTTYTKQLMAWAYNRRGEELAEGNQDDKAFNDFSAAINLDAARWKAYHNRGVSYALQNKTREAMADFNRAIELNRAYPNTWFNRGLLRARGNDLAGAIGDFSAAIRLAPQEAGFYNSRAQALARVKMPREALRDFDEAVRLQPGDVGFLTDRGEAHIEQGNYAPASTDFREALRMNPKFGRAYRDAAWLMATCPDPRFRDPDKGLEAAQKAIEFDGATEWHYLDALAAAQANAGKFDDAQRTVTQAIDAASEKTGGPLHVRLGLYKVNQPYRDPVPQRPAPTTTTRPPR